MLRRSVVWCKSNHSNALRNVRPQFHRYKQLSRWQREAQGISKWDQAHSHRPQPHLQRFSPESVGLTRGTSSFAWKWWFTQQPWLPNVPPDGYVAPQPAGLRPASWATMRRSDDEDKDKKSRSSNNSDSSSTDDDGFVDAVLAMSDEELRAYLLEQLTDVIFAETQRDGYELRRLDFEGKPLTALPEPRIILSFVFDESTLRERVLAHVVEGIFRLAPTSRDRAELRSVQNIIDYVVAHVTAARPPARTTVTPAARAVMRAHALQPRLGFVHALPTDNRDAVVREWERSHHLDWQFGNAVYTPRDREVVRGNWTWLREQHHHADRTRLDADVASGEARRRHLARIAEAAAAAQPAMSA